MPTSTMPPAVVVEARDLLQSTVFATSGLGGVLGWVVVHPIAIERKKQDELAEGVLLPPRLMQRLTTIVQCLGKQRH